MSLLVDVREVPWRILEAVQARILANRERKQRREQAARVRGFTRPRPQQRRMGATMSSYRAPEPVPLILGDGGTSGLVWLAQPARLKANFAASWMWSSLLRLPSTGQPEQFLIDANDRYTFSVGSGDGSTWLAGSLHLPGIHAFRQAYYGFLSPGLPASAIVGVSGYYVSDPVGSFFRATQFISDDSLLRAFCLPVGNGSALVLVMARAGGCWAASKMVVTDSQQVTINGQTVWTFSQEQTQFVVSEPQTVQASDVQAYLVSQTSCRAVPVPQALRDRLDDLLLGAEITNPIPWVPVTGVPAINVFTATGPDEYWYSDGIYRYRKYQEFSNLELFSGYAAQSDVMEIPGQWPYLTPGAYTPAVYVPLLKYQELFAASEFPNYESPIFSYAEGRSRLRALGAPAPTHVVGFDVRLPDYQAIQAALWNGEPDYEGGFRWPSEVYRDTRKLLQGLTPVRSNTQPANLYDQLPQAGAWQPLRRLALDPNRAQPYGADTLHSWLWHYDWAQPAYCRQQLLALGFSEADLTP